MVQPGLNILSELKELGKADGVLIISAKNSLNDKLHGLNLGADDYLTKPFHLPELLHGWQLSYAGNLWMKKIESLPMIL